MVTQISLTDSVIKKGYVMKIVNEFITQRTIYLFLLGLSVLTVQSLYGCSNTIQTPSKQKNKTEKINVLIVDGQNNHSYWSEGTLNLKRLLEDTGLFNVDIYRTQYTWKGLTKDKTFTLNDGNVYIDGKPKTDPNFSPTFSNYNVVLSNFGLRAAPWPKKTKNAFEHYMKNGGGFVALHAANNSFPTWLEYNKMIGLGGWGKRNETNGPMLYFNTNGHLIKDKSIGKAGNHGNLHEFTVMHRITDHPITQGFTSSWLHTKDELYSHLRGPAENLTVLATAYSDEKEKGSSRHEPILMTINYHQGRVFHMTLGHDEIAYKSLGFVTMIQRGTEWAATGKVTQEVPKTLRKD